MCQTRNEPQTDFPRAARVCTTLPRCLRFLESCKERNRLPKEPHGHEGWDLTARTLRRSRGAAPPGGPCGHPLPAKPSSPQPGTGRSRPGWKALLERDTNEKRRRAALICTTRTLMQWRDGVTLRWAGAGAWAPQKEIVCVGDLTEAFLPGEKGEDKRKKKTKHKKKKKGKKKVFPFHWLCKAATTQHTATGAQLRGYQPSASPLHSDRPVHWDNWEHSELARTLRARAGCWHLCLLKCIINSLYT